MIIRNMEKNDSAFVVDPKRDFIRKSELSFSKTMRFILDMGSQTLGKELMNFYGIDPKMVSVSAIVQRRAKILLSDFQNLFHEFNKVFSQTGFRQVLNLSFRHAIISVKCAQGYDTLTDHTPVFCVI